MKKLTIPGLACVLAFLAVTPSAWADATAEWQAVLATIQTASGQSVSGRERSGIIVRTALSAAASGLPEKAKPARPAEAVPPAVSIDAAAAQAAYATLAVLYPDQIVSLDLQLARSLAGLIDDPNAIAAGRAWGDHVAQVILADHDTEVFLNAFTFSSSPPTSVPTLPETTGPGSYLFFVLAGSPVEWGSADGPGNAARFNSPDALAVDHTGNVFVADFGNHTIRKVAPDGLVTTLAGLAGSPGSADGSGDARFNYPSGLAVDNTGNVYVADTGNHTIRRITPAGVVSTLAGSPGFSGFADGNGRDARFYLPADVTVDKAGNIYVADGLYYPTSKIRKITPEGTVSTIAERFSGLLAITIDPLGNLYALDSDGGDLFGNWLMKFRASNGGQYVANFMNTGTTAQPTALTVDEAGNLFVAFQGGQIFKFTPGGDILHPALTGQSPYPADIALDGVGNLYSLSARDVADRHIILKGVFNPGGLAINRQPANQLVSLGETAVFTVEAAGQPAPTYQWFRDSVALDGATSPTLTLSHVQLSDAGGAYGSSATYTVVVTSGASSLTSKPAYLTIRPPEDTSSVKPSDAAKNASGGGGAPSGWFVGTLALLLAARRWRGHRTIAPNE